MPSPQPRLEHDAPAGRGWLRQLCEPAHLILLLTPILLTLWVYFGRHVSLTPESLPNPLPVAWDVFSVLWEYLAAFVLMFVIPALIVRLAWRQPLAAFGFTFSDWRLGLRLVAAIAPVMLLAAWLGSFDPAMQAEYPQARSALASLPLFLLLEGVYLVYYLGWEFLFRGFMLFGLEKSYGALAAILIQTIPSTLVHIGKPFNETFSAIFAGILFGFVAWRTRSILYPLILHALVGIGTDVFAALAVMK